MPRLLAVVIMLIPVQCKFTTISDPESVLRANDAVKIAANYIGDARCRAYLQELQYKQEDIDQVIRAHAKFAAHRLDGADGELITKQFKDARGKPQARLSGDRFLQRDSNHHFNVETIETNCRRLVLSVDSLAAPTIELKHGFIVRNQQEQFKRDFGEQGFGTLTCGEDFCTFSNVKGGQRYFAMLEPSAQHKHIEFSLDYLENDNKQMNIAKIELENIHYQDRFRYQDQDRPQVAPSGRPNLGHSHFDYVRNLYVRVAGGSNLRSHPRDTLVKVSLQHHYEEQIQQSVAAKTNIVLNSNDPRQKVAIMDVKDICRNILANECNAQLTNFPTMLLQKQDIKLVLEFVRRLKDKPVYDHHVHTAVIAMDNDLLTALLNRKGQRTVQGHGWAVDFTFNHPSSKHLHLYANLSDFDFITTSASPSRPMPTPSGNLLLRDGYNCAGAKDFNYSSGITKQANSNNRYLLMQISRAQVTAHFKKQSCFAELARGKNDRQFLKALAPTLFLRISGTSQSQSEWRYKLTQTDIDNWFDGRGGVHIPLSTASPSSPPLGLGFQDRR